MFCMIEIAFDKKNEVNETINTLLYKKLAASCQVIESNNVWNWVGERETAKEYLLHIKTKEEFVTKIYQVVKKIHSYEVFEFAVYPFNSPSSEYLDWITGETQTN